MPRCPGGTSSCSAGGSRRRREEKGTETEKKRRFSGRVRAGALLAALLAFGVPAAAEWITLPARLERIGESAFAGCESAAEIVVPGEFPLAVGAGAIPEGAAVYAAGAARESLENGGVRFPSYQALLIGQSYEGMGEEDELSGCIEDAETTAEILAESDMVRYGQGRIATLYDATRNEILAGIAALAEGADERTVSVFYYSGHGGEGGYLIGYDRRTHRQEWLNPAILARAFAAVPGRKIILIDACFSGALISRGAEAVPERFAEAFLSAFREPAARSGELQAENTHVLVAATGEEYSQSIGLSEAWFGVFTAYLQEGLCGGREDLRHMTWYERFPEDRSEALLAGSLLPADADGDRMVTVGEAYRYVRSGTFRFIRTWNRVYGERLGTIGQTVSVWPEDSDAVLFGR